MHELTSPQKRELKAKAHALKPVVLIGNNGLTDAVIAEIDNALGVHELIKVKAHGADKATLEGISLAVTRKCQCASVADIGRILIFFRPKEK